MNSKALTAKLLKGYEIYQSGKKLADVALDLGYKSGSTVLYHFQKHGLQTRKRGGAIKKSQVGKDNGNWKGGIVKGKKEYIRVWMPTHQRADSTGYVYEHILIAEQSTGRCINKKEVVHHINGNKRDNTPNNLLVCTQNEHINIHREKGGLI